MAIRCQQAVGDLAARSERKVQIVVAQCGYCKDAGEHAPCEAGPSGPDGWTYPCRKDVAQLKLLWYLRIWLDRLIYPFLKRSGPIETCSSSSFRLGGWNYPFLKRSGPIETFLESCLRIHR